MKRIIVDYKKLTPEVLSLLVDKYPYGYDDDHVITFKNHKDEKGYVVLRLGVIRQKKTYCTPVLLGRHRRVRVSRTSVTYECP